MSARENGLPHGPRSAARTRRRPRPPVRRPHPGTKSDGFRAGMRGSAQPYHGDGSDARAVGGKRNDYLPPKSIPARHARVNYAEAGKSGGWSASASEPVSRSDDEGSGRG